MNLNKLLNVAEYRKKLRREIFWACFLECSNTQKRQISSDNFLQTESEQANSDGENWSLGIKVLYGRSKKKKKKTQEDAKLETWEQPLDEFPLELVIMWALF